MPALNRTFALVEMNAVAMMVRQDLDLDMPRPADKFLDKHTVICKTRARLTGCPLKPLTAFIIISGNPHALAAPTCARHEHDGVSDLSGTTHRIVGIDKHLIKTRNGRHPCALGQGLGSDLVTHDFNRRCRGADKSNSHILQTGNQRRFFREKTVSGMHRVGTGCLAGIDDPLHQKITFSRSGCADVNSLISHQSVRRITVSI